MIAHKHITKIVTMLITIVTFLCLFLIFFSASFSAGTSSFVSAMNTSGDANNTTSGITMEYETKLFDTSSPIQINIQMEEEQWNEMLDNALSENYYHCDVEINGETFYRVGIRPKGNTSLSSIASDPTTDRYSFKLEFDQYVDGQTCFGLDKLVLNNNYADATNMKEALIYDMYQYMGADASLYNYAAVSVNGEYWGVYLALEAVEDSFLLRNYGAENGKLYKPDSMEIGGKPEENGKPEKNDNPEENGNPGANDNSGEDGNFKGGGFGKVSMETSMGNGGSNLNYTDDSLDSYSSIWDSKVNSTSKSDHKRVVTALKNISEGTDLETYMDIDNLLNYMAVHVFSVNEDSLSGNMAHNYYLYEHAGQLNLLPWDYNLAFGSFGNMGGGGMGGMRNGRETDGNINSTSASNMINDAIDTPFSGTEFFDTLLAKEEYLAEYHSRLAQLIEGYVNGGAFEAFYERVRSQIDTLVETDPTAFYSYEEYLTAVQMLYDTVLLRAQSIQGQLDGTIPSTDDGQRADSSALVDASDINIEVMGMMNRGGENSEAPEAIEGFAPFQPGESGTEPDTETESGTESEQAEQNSFGRDNRMKMNFGDNLPEITPGGDSLPTITKNLIIDAVCFLILLGAVVFVARYRRKSYRR